MSEKKSQEAIGLGGYAAQRLDYGNTCRAFPIETIEIRIAIISEVSK